MWQPGYHHAMCTLDPMALRPYLLTGLPLVLIIQFVYNNTKFIGIMGKLQIVFICFHLRL